VIRTAIISIGILALMLAVAFAEPEPGPGAAQTENVPSAATLHEAFERLLQGVGAQHPFALAGGSLFLHVDTDGDRNTPLAAMLERESRLVFSATHSFAFIYTAEDLPFDATTPDAAALARLERFGVDRVIDISAELAGNRLVLRARALWLEGGSFAPILAQPVEYPEQRARVTLAANPQWLLLARPESALGELRLSWKTRALGESPGRALALAVGDINGDVQPDMALLFADRLEIYVGDGDSLCYQTMIDLRDEARAAARTRFHAGEVLICNHDGRPAVALGSTALGGGLVLQGDGQRLAKAWELAGAPMACTDSGVLVAPYREGSWLLDGFVLSQRPDGETVSLLEWSEPTLRLRPLPGGLAFLALGPQGNLFYVGRSSSAPELHCGAGLALAPTSSGAQLACSAAEIRPLHDSVQLAQLHGDSLTPEEQFDKIEGEIWAVAIWPHPLGARVLSAVYNPTTDRTSVIMTYRGSD
jgi:hypothetical protein